MVVCDLESHNEDVPLIGKQMGEVCVMIFVCIKIIQFPYKYTLAHTFHTYRVGGGSNKSLRNNPFCKLMYFGERYMLNISLMNKCHIHLTLHIKGGWFQEISWNHPGVEISTAK